MQRREFLDGSAALPSWGKLGLANQLPSDLWITRAIGFDVVSRRPKLVGKNSRLDVYGETARDRMLRLQTNMGVEGIGNCRAPEDAVAKLIGKNPFDFFQRDKIRNFVLKM